MRFQSTTRVIRVTRVILAQLALTFAIVASYARWLRMRSTRSRQRWRRRPRLQGRLPRWDVEHREGHVWLRDGPNGYRC